MRVLHILKSEPDDDVVQMMNVFADDDNKTVKLFEGEVDWSALVDDIFEYDKIICWW